VVPTRDKGRQPHVQVVGGLVHAIEQLVHRPEWCYKCVKLCTAKSTKKMCHSVHMCKSSVVLFTPSNSLSTVLNGVTNVSICALPSLTNVSLCAHVQVVGGLVHAIEQLVHGPEWCYKCVTLCTAKSSKCVTLCTGLGRWASER
jgi:hypothetical protein